MNVMRRVGVTAAGIAIGAAIALAQSAASKWVYLGADQKLHYQTTERGDRIMDFSHAGYKGGGVTPPTVRTMRTVQPSPGDNTAQIQAAMDAVASLGPDADGFRGAVLLAPGVFETAGTVTIGASGVVLRGSGAGPNGTTIRMTGAPHRLLDIRGTGTWKEAGQPAKITDAYVPSGADSFEVKSTAGFAPGDKILIRRPVTEAWVHFMGMDTLVRDGKQQTWIKPGTSIRTDRVIKTISKNRITLDVPLSDALDASMLGTEGATIVKYDFPGRISQVGIESLRVIAPADDKPITEGQFTMLRMDAVSDAWARDISIEETQNGVTIGASARRVTLYNVRIRHSITHTGAAAPADFGISGTQILLSLCWVSGKGTWPVVTQAMVTGPNVVLGFFADEAGVSPHQRWATGLLVDASEFRNNTARRPGIAFSNRKTAGSGHGWDIGWGVAWNVQSNFLLIPQPPGALNWCIGCVGEVVEALDAGTIDSAGRQVLPRSLYLQQLKDRLGKSVE
jgi:hypothetical protein